MRDIIIIMKPIRLLKSRSKLVFACANFTRKLIHIATYSYILIRATLYIYKMHDKHIS